MRITREEYAYMDAQDIPVSREDSGARKSGRQLPAAGILDTAFSENRGKGVHRWTPWIAGFSGSFVGGVLERESPNGESLRVLDPFAGVGTTLVEAVAGGHDAVGFEINPCAALACDAKANIPAYDAGRFADAIARFRAFADEKPWLKSPPASAPPAGFISRAPFFSPEIELQTLGCVDFIREETSGWLRRLFDLALGSVMVGFSNYSYEPSLGTRAGAGKPNIESADVAGIIERKLRDMLDDIIEFQTDEARRDGEAGKAVVHPVSYMEHADRVARGSVDVVITSPPYLNNYHYIRNTRPQLYWLGLVSAPSELKRIERESFGRFWQTVRAGAEVAPGGWATTSRPNPDRPRGAGGGADARPAAFARAAERFAKPPSRKGRLRRAWLGELRGDLLQRLPAILPSHNAADETRRRDGRSHRQQHTAGNRISHRQAVRGDSGAGRVRCRRNPRGARQADGKQRGEFIGAGRESAERGAAV